MRYICVSSVRKEFEPFSPRTPVVTVGSTRDADEEPSRVAYRGVADLNAAVRVEDHKFEIEGVAVIDFDQQENLIERLLNGMLIHAPDEDMKDYRQRLSMLESLLDRYAAQVYAILDPIEEVAV